MRAPRDTGERLVKIEKNSTARDDAAEFRIADRTAGFAVSPIARRRRIRRGNHAGVSRAGAPRPRDCPGLHGLAPAAGSEEPGEPPAPKTINVAGWSSDASSLDGPDPIR